MPRAALNTREVEEPKEPREHRTGPRETSNVFRPAQRSIPPHRGSMPPQRQVFDDQENEGEEIATTQPVTKSGHPDRRYKGQRDLPPPPEAETNRARTGGTVGDIHITIDGKPDRRFKENRSLSEEEVTRNWLDAMNEKFGHTRQR